ncbi:MAG: class I SAM-dependent rRNA methyltransferase, partial [Bacteroidetes bacterium]
MKTIELKPGKDKAVKRFHPWIFSGAIRNLENESVEDGELVRVNDHKGRFLAIGHFHNGSIAVRILTFDEEEINAGFWQKRIQDAFAYRRMLGLPAPGKTTCYRLLHAEGDRLPGLVVDVYNHVAVVQCHSIGMHRSVGEIADAILERAEGDIVAVYDKSSETLPANYAASLENAYIRGDAEAEPVLENGIQFKVDWVTG